MNPDYPFTLVFNSPTPIPEPKTISGRQGYPEVFEQVLETRRYPTLGSLYEFLDDFFLDNPFWGGGPGTVHRFFYGKDEVSPYDQTPIVSIITPYSSIIYIDIPTVPYSKRMAMQQETFRLIYNNPGEQREGEISVENRSDYPTVGSLYSFFYRKYCPPPFGPCDITLRNKFNSLIYPSDSTPLQTLVDRNGQVKVFVEPSNF